MTEFCINSQRSGCC